MAFFHAKFLNQITKYLFIQNALSDIYGLQILVPFQTALLQMFWEYSEISNYFHVGYATYKGGPVYRTS